MVKRIPNFFFYILCCVLLILLLSKYLKYPKKRFVVETIGRSYLMVLKSKCECKKSILSLINEIGYYEVKINNITFYNTSKETFNPGLAACNLYNTLRRGIKQKIISYSLYGTNPRYYNNLKKIAKQAKKLYPDWTIRIHHDDSINSSVICEIECLKNDENGEYLDNVDFCDMNRIPYGSQVETWNANYINKMIWRWLPIGDPFVDIFISRDSDSPLSQREVDAVNEWLNSKTLFHIMRDHPLHDVEILGGLWGLKTYSNRQLSNELFNTISSPEIAVKYKLNKKGPDQDFLRDYFWKHAKKSSTIHDSYSCMRLGGVGFPSKRPLNKCFVGCVGDCCEDTSLNFIPECNYECRLKDHRDWNYC